MSEIEQLIGKLGDPKTLVEARKRLIDMGAPAVEALIAACGSSNQLTRKEAATVLGSIGDAHAAQALMDLTRDPVITVRTDAIHALGNIKNEPHVLEFLMRLARESQDTTVRPSAVFAAARLGGEELGNQLWLEMLNDPSPQVVANAASRLGGTKKPEFVEPLIALLKRLDEQSPAANMTLMALGQTGDKRAFEPLVAFLNSPNVHRRVSAIGALGQLGDERALDLLEKLKRDKTVAGQDDHGPAYTVGSVAEQAMERIRKANGKAAAASEVKPEKKSRWKLW